ncbi:putative hydrolase [Rhizoctonia solani 123E]|uniref:Putative hydrolase n=1 Tax=Rhizoctonia solani 123E TaxID=1423351 RepID=A0A074RYC2_9AGAM|nr:putative hydrolase [Rhizoctonia solani 123E]
MTRLIGLLALTSAVVARDWILPEGFHRFAPRSTGFSWEPCDDGSGSGYQGDCSWFEVPLDWGNITAGKTTLAVARYNATKQPRLGTLFMNPGGPGVSGLEMITKGDAAVYSAMSGGQYDIVGWDPRGVGLSHPRAECFKTATEERSFWEGTIPDAGLEARGNFTDQHDIDVFYEQVDEVDVLLKKVGKKCLEYSPDTWQYIGTAAGVRDMIAMHDVLEGPSKPIDYWGISYGTVIGIYFVNMFPERVGRVVLDGVVDPVYWANLPPHKLWGVGLESTDEAFNGFVTACAAAGPSGCALATKDSNAETIRKFVIDLIDLGYYNRRKFGPTAEGSALVRNKIFKAMYSPRAWPDLAKELLSMHERFVNATDALNHTQSKRRSTYEHGLDPIRRQANSTTSDEDPAPVYSNQGITCGDAIDPGTTTTKEVFDFLVNVTRTVSPMFGPSWGISGFFCHHWPVRAVERYTGPWNKKLSNPILVIGNEADPITPYISAKRVADALGDSAVLIEQDDYGHAAVAMISKCTISALQNYFVNNTLPSEDKFCGTDQELFPGPPITKNSLSKQSSSSNNVATVGFDSLHDELEKTLQRSNSLFIAVIALAVATGLLLLGLIFSFVYARRGSKVQHTKATFISRGAFEKASDEQGHTYNNPYESGAKPGGYSRVEN